VRRPQTTHNKQADHGHCQPAADRGNCTGSITEIVGVSFPG